VSIRVIAGTIDKVHGPVTGIAADPLYMDVSVPAQTLFIQPIERGHTAFLYVYEGEAQFAGQARAEKTKISSPKLVVLGDGDHVEVLASQAPVRFLLISGKPLHEPIARYGPFVMNTKEEIDRTLLDIRQGTFIVK
jgi:redox-sensitive bicupin YhaK (pirin superfamily)